MIVRAFITIYSVVLVGLFLLFGYLITYIKTPWRNGRLKSDDRFQDKVVIFSTAAVAGQNLEPSICAKPNDPSCPLVHTTDGAVLLEYKQPIRPEFKTKEKLNLFEFLKHNFSKTRENVRLERRYTPRSEYHTIPATQKPYNNDIQEIVLKIMNEKGEPRIEINVGAIEPKLRRRRSRPRRRPSRSKLDILIKRNDTVFKSKLTKVAEFQLLPNNTLLIFDKEAGTFAAINVNAEPNEIAPVKIKEIDNNVDVNDSLERDLENLTRYNTKAADAVVVETVNVSVEQTINTTQHIFKLPAVTKVTKDSQFSTLKPLENLTIVEEDIIDENDLLLNHTTTEENPLIINLLEWQLKHRDQR